MMSRYDAFGKFLFFLFICLILTQPCPAGATGNQKGDVPRCGILTEQDARTILDGLRLTEAKILKIQASPIQDLWEIAAENKGDRFLVYVDCSKTFVMPGPVIEYRTGIDRTRQRVDELNRDKRVSLAGLRFEESLVMGSSSAPIKVTVFLDPD